MTTTGRRIVVGYDGSGLADQALHWASETATDRDVVDVLVAAPMSDAAQAWGVEERSLEQMTEVAERAEKELAALGRLHTSVEVQRGEPAALLERAAAEADLLVVGATGHGPVHGALVGSVSRHLAVHATCPLVVVRPARGPDPRIVVGLDDQWDCSAALEHAMRHAELTGAPVHALHVRHSVDAFGTDASYVPRQVRETWEQAHRAHPGVDLTLMTPTGRPAATLVDASADASLVVLGARGHRPFARKLLASVGQQVLHHAHCPVVIVR